MNNTILWLNLETYSEVPIRNGTHAYAEHTEIMLFAWAINNNPVQVWDITNDTTIPAELHQSLLDPTVTLFAHNSHFDRTVLRYYWPGFDHDISRWRDTMVHALVHGLPGALGELCEVLGVPQDKAKDKEGKALIQLFCKPRPKHSALRRATSKTHPEEWRRFVEYAALDIEAMCEVHKRLSKWNYQSAIRGVIIAPDGKKLVISGLSNIEGRMLAWLAGEDRKIKAFSDFDKGIGSDLYKLAYTRAFNIEPEDVTKDQRQIGKVMELGLGYGGGVAAFLTFALTYGLDLEELATAALPNIPVKIQRNAMSWYKKSVELEQTYGLSERVFITCDSFKHMWRNAHPETGRSGMNWRKP